MSVLFVDLVGFTSYSQGRDAEDVRGLLNDYFQRAGEIIGLHGGVVEKFIGDAVMAVWGTPVAREDDTGRAVRAALELVESVAALGKSVDANLEARAGIYTGEAAVNLAAQGQGMVAGDMVNTASRLQAVAQPGTILVDRATYLGARDAIAFESVGNLMLKGKEAAVEAWRPTRVTAVRGGFRPDDTLEPAFTGRDEEFRLIKDLLHATGREGRPRLASLVGIGGIGKSRLVWEFLKYVDGLSEVVLWHQGRSPAYGEGIAFWALSEMVQMRAGIAETDDDAQALPKLEECLARYVPDEDERRWLRPQLANLLGIEEVSDTGQEQLFAAWRTFFERVAAHGTVVLVFEDLHWADQGLIDFIEHVMAWARTGPILILTLARPELLDRRPNWGAGQRNFVSVHLEPLNKDDMALLLKSLADDLPIVIRDEIIERAEGVPLYAVEMVRMLIDRADLALEGDQYHWVGRTEHIEVPDSLHSLIASRLDALGTEDRLLVQDAAVLGKTFTTAALAAVANAPSHELEKRLNDLVQREILIIDTDPRSPERGQYGFVQSLIREVAYQTLSNQNRKVRHLAAAEYFASLGETDLIDAVATHYIEAYNNTRKGDDAEAIAARARGALVDAAKRARSLGSIVQSLSLLEKALSVTEEAGERGHLLYEAGTAASRTGQAETAIGYLRSSIELLRESGDTDLRAQAQAQLGVAYFLASKLDEAEEMLGEAIDELEDKSTGTAAQLLTEAARIQVFKGDYDRGERYTRLAMPAAERAERLDLIAEALITRGVGAILSGRPHEADALLGGALKLSEEHGLVPQQMRALINISANELQVNPIAAMEAGERAMETARKFGSREHEAFALASVLEAGLHLARWEYLHATLSDLDDLEVGDMTLILLPVAAMIEAYAGDLENARRYLTDYEEQIGDTSSVQDQGLLAACRATIAFAENDFAGAMQFVADSDMGTDDLLAPYGLVGRAALWAGNLDAAERELERLNNSTIRNAWLSTIRTTLEAGILALRGDRERAVDRYEHALGEWGKLSIPLGRAMCQTDFALLIGGPEAADASAEAEAFFSAAHNDRFVRRLRESRGPA